MLIKKPKEVLQYKPNNFFYKTTIIRPITDHNEPSIEISLSQIKTQMTRDYPENKKQNENS